MTAARLRASAREDLVSSCASPRCLVRPRGAQLAAGLWRVGAGRWPRLRRAHDGRARSTAPPTSRQRPLQPPPEPARPSSAVRTRPGTAAGHTCGRSSLAQPIDSVRSVRFSPPRSISNLSVTTTCDSWPSATMATTPRCRYAKGPYAVWISTCVVSTAMRWQCSAGHPRLGS